MVKPYLIDKQLLKGNNYIKYQKMELIHYRLFHLKQMEIGMDLP